MTTYSSRNDVRERHTDGVFQVVGTNKEGGVMRANVGGTLQNVDQGDRGDSDRGDRDSSRRDRDGLAASAQRLTGNPIDLNTLAFDLGGAAQATLSIAVNGSSTDNQIRASARLAPCR